MQRKKKKEIHSEKDDEAIEPRGERGDDLTDDILQLFNQSTERNPFFLDKSQPHIQELTLRSGNQPSIVAYLSQTY